MIKLIVAVLMACAIGLFALIVWQFIRQRPKMTWSDNLLGGGIGLVTDFLDTLGIGSFVTTTTLFHRGAIFCNGGQSGYFDDGFHGIRGGGRFVNWKRSGDSIKRCCDSKSNGVSVNCYFNTNGR